MKNPPSEIMVAGCGNSTLCEDLWREGMTRLAMDFSDMGVINVCGIKISTSMVICMNIYIRAIYIGGRWSISRVCGCDLVTCRLPEHMWDGLLLSCDRRYAESLRAVLHDHRPLLAGILPLCV